MVNEVDVDGNGTIEFAEFVILMTNKVKEMSKEEEILEAFNIIDKEKDSLISVKELKYFMRKVAHIKLSSEEAEAMIEFADSDEDGFVTYDDFLQVISLAQGGEGGDEPIEEEEDSQAESDGLRGINKWFRIKLNRPNEFRLGKQACVCRNRQVFKSLLGNKGWIWALQDQDRLKEN